jgi:hypothetical protein
MTQGRTSLTPPAGRQLPDVRMLWKWTDLLRFTHFPVH